MKILKPSLAMAFVALSSPAFALECEDGMRAFEHAAGETCIPEGPQRIVSLHRLTTTLTLLELGGPDIIVASEGLTEADGYFIDLVDDLLDIDLTDTDIMPLGWSEPDFEALAVLEPDLIIARPYEEEIYEQLQLIAPMVSLPIDVSFVDYIGIIADAAGLSTEYEQHKATYLEALAAVKAQVLDAEDLSITVMYADDESLEVYDNFYALTEVTDAIGFGRTEEAKAVFADFDGAYDHATSLALSPERLDTLDADVLFAAVWPSADDERSLRQVMRASLEMQVPGWCDFLEVCQAGQVVYFDPTATYAGSFASLHAALDLVKDQIVNRDLQNVVE